MDSDMEVYLRARGVASVFMTDDALGAFWSGAWFLNQVGPSSLWQWSDLWERFLTQVDSENCGQVGGEEAGGREQPAIANNNPTDDGATKRSERDMDENGWF